MYPRATKKKAIRLRKQGKTYGEIRKIINLDIPKSTLSVWCENILLSQLQKKNIEISQQRNITRGMKTAWLVNKMRRDAYLAAIDHRIINLPNFIKDKNIAKIAAAMLYLGEGTKDIRRGSLMLGNSDPKIIKLFLRLLRHAYLIDESKFRCTLQCRADQNIKKLEKFWSKHTEIPLTKFYKARIDPRTIGKPTKKLDYKGVCVINYLSADLFIEIMKIGTLIAEGPIA